MWRMPRSRKLETTYCSDIGGLLERDANVCNWCRRSLSAVLIYCYGSKAATGIPPMRIQAAVIKLAKPRVGVPLRPCPDVQPPAIRLPRIVKNPPARAGIVGTRESTRVLGSDGSAGRHCTSAKPPRPTPIAKTVESDTLTRRFRRTGPADIVLSRPLPALAFREKVTELQTSS